MIISRTYKIGDLRSAIRESVNEFKPMKGKGVDKENKTNNDKTYSDAKKRAKSYDGGARAKNNKLSEYPNIPNKGMQDLQYDGKIPSAFKKNVMSQMRGYTSSQDEKLNKDNSPHVERNEIPKMKERAQQFKKNRDTQTMLGLTGREMNKKEVEQLRDTVFESKANRYKFKTQFLNEEHMLVKLPDECKREGKKSIMEDVNGTTYYVVWHKDKPEVLNKTKVNEEAGKIMDLMSYKAEDVHTTNTIRMNENAMVENMMNKVRNLMKESK